MPLYLIKVTVFTWKEKLKTRDFINCKYFCNYLVSLNCVRTTTKVVSIAENVLEREREKKSHRRSLNPSFVS